MATMIDAKPEYRGEAKVWERLERFLPQSIVVYNHREVNGREFDFCLLIQDMGVLVIEVKGWIADKITVRGIDEIVVEGYDRPQSSPKKQARGYRFALLDQIKETHNVSPCVFDMVCYPFINRAEYRNTRLDIVSEERFTICREDLEDGEALLRKIRMAYDAFQYIPHAVLTADQIMQLRQAWEPQFELQVQAEGGGGRPYSVLSVHLGVVSDAAVDRMVTAYFAGAKQIVFLGDPSSYARVAEAFRHAFQARNIEPDGSRLRIGHDLGLVARSYAFRAFQLEVYCVERLDEIAAADCVIEEGTADRALLERLSAATGFNYQQYLVEHAAAEHNILVEAGAGTGKTFSMVLRVAFLCNKRTDAVMNLADEIAMVTFTNDAANNMKVRLKQMFVSYFVLTNEPRYLKFIEDVDRAHISTIHRFAFEILRGAAFYTGLGTKFRIASNEYMRAKLYDAYLGEFLVQKEEENPNFMHELPVPIYELKKKLLGIADCLLTKSVLLEEIKRAEMGVEVNGVLPYFNDLIERVVIPAESAYTAAMHDANAVDLTACIRLLCQVLHQQPEKSSSLRLRYLFVDEFQDTDDVQIQTIQELQRYMDVDCRLFVVGDLKQSIYRFRGARLSAFEQLKKHSLFPWDTHHLTINYRTDHRLLDAFHEIFARMGRQKYLPYNAPHDRLTGSVRTSMPEEALLRVVDVHRKNEEQFFDRVIAALREQEGMITDLMRARADTGQPPLTREERSVAVLVRSNWQAERLVREAKKRGVLLHTKFGSDLYQLPSTHDLYKLLLALENAAHPLHLINFIESNYTGLRLDYQRYHGMGEAACAADLRRVLDEFFHIHMNKTWQQVVNEAYTQPILFVLKHLYDALQPWKQHSHRAEEQRSYRVNYEYLMECIIGAAQINTLTLSRMASFLKVHILTNQKRAAREIQDAEETDIRLLCSTVHKAKGLEYGSVILPYTDEDISRMRKVQLEANYSDAKLSYIVSFSKDVVEKNSNYDRDIEITEQIAEESRMLYVALTRAVHSCVWMRNMDSRAVVSWGTLMEE